MGTQRRRGRRTPDTTEEGDSRQAHLLIVAHEASADRCHGRRIQVPQVVIVQIQQMDTIFPQQIEERCGIRPVLLMGIDDIDHGEHDPQDRQEPEHGQALHEQQQQGADTLTEGQHHGRS